MSRIKVVYLDRSMPDLKEVGEVLERLDAELIDGQCGSAEEIIALSKDAKILITEELPVGEEVFLASPQLELVVANCIGYDMVDVPSATRHGIPVCNNPDYCIDEVAEHTIAMLLCLARKIPLAHKRVCAGHYDYNDLTPLYRVQKSTVGFMGFGRIARLTAQKMKTLVGRTVFYDPYVEASEVEGSAKVSMEVLLRTSDYVCLHMPLTPETHNLINKETLDMMKPTACLINSARGEVVDTDALTVALDNGKLSGAALDVVANEDSLCPENPLCQMDNVILTPHSAWYSNDALLQVKTDLAGELERFIKKEPLRFLLNPEFAASS